MRAHDREDKRLCFHGLREAVTSNPSKSPQKISRPGMDSEVAVMVNMQGVNVADSHQDVTSPGSLPGAVGMLRGRAPA